MLAARKAEIVALWLMLHLMGGNCRLLSRNDDSCTFKEHSVFEEAVARFSTGQLYKFNVEDSHILNLSEKANALSLLEEFLLPDNSGEITIITVLNMSSTGLTRVPTFTNTTGNRGLDMASQLRVLILANNNLSASFGQSMAQSQDVDVVLSAHDALRVEPRISQRTSGRSEGMNGNYYPELLQLDLRNCSISYIGDHSFETTPNLELLHLDRNIILTIESLAFFSLLNLKYLGVSKNNYAIEKTISSSRQSDVLIFKGKVFEPLPNLTILDLSYSRVSSTSTKIFSNLGENFSVLSLCNSQITFLPRRVFRNTQMKLLDISGNLGILNDSYELFDGIQDSLEILLAESIGLSRMDPLDNLKNLKILSLKYNLIRNLSYNNLITLPNLVILDFVGNRITNWFDPIFRHMPHLKYLSLSNNNLSLLSSVMLKDFANLEFIGINGNTFVCTCFIRIFIEVAEAHRNVVTAFNIEKFVQDILDNISENIDSVMLEDIIHPISRELEREMSQADLTTNIDDDTPFWTSWNLTFRMIDSNLSRLTCLESDTGKIKNFVDVDFCANSKGYQTDMELLQDRQLNLLYILLGASTILIPLAGFIAWKWWYIRYFVVMVKNVAMLSLMKKNIPDKDPDHPFAYDVFVSYCKGDREWVLNELLVHIEEKSNINVCLHERDFQVGLSILENIITCIDRSRAILLVVSQEFLLSQWCQFEMHLAQHRLLETRREKLIIILLEDIPKRKRPNTLHYLMLTKTYIIWPKKSKLNLKLEQDVFWRRLKKSLLNGKETYDVGTFA